MSRRRKPSKPFDPAAAARLAEQARNDAQRLALPSNADVVVEAETRTNAQRSRRESILTRLVTDPDDRSGTARRKQALDLLAETLAARYREDKDHSLRIRVQEEGSAAEITLAQIMAGRRLDRIVATGGPLMVMLIELVRPTLNLPWRMVVQRYTRETHDHAQASAVRMAADLAYHILCQSLDRGHRVGHQTLQVRFAPA